MERIHDVRQTAFWFTRIAILYAILLLVAWSVYFIAHEQDGTDGGGQSVGSSILFTLRVLPALLLFFGVPSLVLLIGLLVWCRRAGVRDFRIRAAFLLFWPVVVVFIVFTSWIIFVLQAAVQLGFGLLLPRPPVTYEGGTNGER